MERQRWFVYASFGHTAAALDSPVVPADDERDNIINVVPHANFAGNAIFEFLPALSRGTGVRRVEVERSPARRHAGIRQQFVEQALGLCAGAAL
jgi:hypothetical protein